MLENSFISEGKYLMGWVWFSNSILSIFLSHITQIFPGGFSYPLSLFLYNIYRRPGEGMVYRRLQMDDPPPLFSLLFPSPFIPKIFNFVSWLLRGCGFILGKALFSGG